MLIHPIFSPLLYWYLMYVLYANVVQRLINISKRLEWSTFTLEIGSMFIMSGFILNGVFLPTLVATVQKSATRNECVTIKSVVLFFIFQVSVCV